jgi:peptide/nickel transport system permease protein
MTPRRQGWLAASVLAALAVAALAGPMVAPNRPSEQFRDRAFAPPMRVHVRGTAGFAAPFVYRQTLDDRLLSRYREDRASPATIDWFRGGRLATVPASHEPLLLLGADAYGRDILSRLLHGARWSLGVTLAGLLGALAIGTIAGGLAGTAGGRVDALLMMAADFVLVLPGAYLVLALRGMLPEVLAPGQVFLVLSLFFSVAAWPHVARGVRAVVAAERARDYAEAARASGAGTLHLMRRLLPAARGFLAVEVVLLVPALLLAEATVSYLGLGFTEPTPSWGTMLQDAAGLSALGLAPWLLAPAAAVVAVVLAVQLAGLERRGLA